MHHLCKLPEGSVIFRLLTTYMSNPGKVLRVIELNHTLRCLCGDPSIPLSFNLAAVIPGGRLIALATALKAFTPPTPSLHRLQLGLPGSLIPFATLAFAS